MTNTPRNFQPFETYHGLVINHCNISGFFEFRGNETYNLNTARLWVARFLHLA